MKLIALWFIGLLFLAPNPSVALWLWLAAPFVVLPLLALHALTAPR